MQSDLCTFKKRRSGHRVRPSEHSGRRQSRREVSEETNAVNILISDFQVTELSESTFMLFKPLLQSVTALAN